MKNKAITYLENIQEATYAFLNIEPVIFNDDFFVNLTEKVRSSEKSFNDNYGAFEKDQKEKLFEDWEKSAQNFSPEILELYKTKSKNLLTKFENPFSIGILENLQLHIEKAIESYFPKYSLNSIKDKAIIGTLPTGEINARAIYVPDSKHYLILFDSEVFNFASYLSKAIAYAMKPVFSMGMLNLSMNVSDIQERLEQDEAVSFRFCYPIISYLLSGKVNSPPYVLSHPFSMMSKKMLDSMELFIMAHEYSHMLLGHLDSNNLSASVLPGINGVNEFQKKWIQEFEADLEGSQIMSAASQTMGYHFYESYLGVDFFFICSMILQRALNVLNTGEDKIWDFTENESSQTHPPLLYRLEFIHQVLKSKLNPREFEGIKMMNNNIIQVAETLWSLTLLPKLKLLHEQGIKPNIIWNEIEKMN